MNKGSHLNKESGVSNEQGRYQLKKESGVSNQQVVSNEQGVSAEQRVRDLYSTRGPAEPQVRGLK